MMTEFTFLGELFL